MKNRFLVCFAFVIMLLNTICCSNSNKEAFTITWKNWDGDILEIDNDVPYGSIPSYDSDIPTKEGTNDYNYVFDGWSPAVSKVTENKTYAAVFKEERIKYTLLFDLDGGSSPSYVSSKEVFSLNLSDFFFDVSKMGYSFRGWSYNGSVVFDEDGNQLSYPTMASEMQFVAIFNQKVKLTITTNMKEAGTIVGDGEYPYNTCVDISVNTYLGYSFVGWYSSNSYLSNSINYQIMLWEEDVTIEARFKLSSFTFNAYVNAPHLGSILVKYQGNTQYSTFSKAYDYTQSITVSVYSKTDVRFLGWYDEDGNVITTNISYSFSMPNYNYTLEARWNYFTISYVLNGGENNKLNPDSYALESGTINLYEPQRYNYKFIGWYLDDKLLTSIDSNIGKNIVLIAKWKMIPVLIDEKISYGLYPQENINDSEIISKLNNLQETNEKGWYFLDGEYYVKDVAVERDREYIHYFSSGTEIICGETYWFKCSPIKWNIISLSDNLYTLASSMLIDYQMFDQNYNNYDKSDIRRWLNNYFYNVAFDGSDDYIVETLVDNSSQTTDYPNNNYCCDDTLDKVSLVSASESCNKAFKTSDYMRAISGIYNHKGQRTTYQPATYYPYTYCGIYWTRSPSHSSGTGVNLSILTGSDTEGTGDFGISSTNKFHYVRPRIVIELY